MEVKSGHIHWSDELYRIVGRVPQAVVLDWPTLRDWIHPDDREQHDLYLQQLSRSMPGDALRCYLPRSGRVSEKQNLPVDEKSQLPRGQETVLVVDDEEGFLELAQQYLEELGYTVVTATSGQQTLEALAEKPSIDLFFSDVMMPGGMNGYELAEQAAATLPGIKVLLTSGYSSRSLYRNGHARFKANLLTKPYSQTDMVRRVRKVLDE